MIGTTVGKYRILARLGRGGMGTVYRAVDETLDREVAIKVLNSEVSDAKLMARFRAEATMLAKLNHPGIATIYEIHKTDTDLMMVMELVSGETLDQLSVRLGPLPPERSAFLVAQVLEALGYAHRAGIVHRDLKPANVMVTDAGTVKIMDFGIARVLGAEHLTSDGTMMGTPAYMAPEQVLGKEVDARADLYAAGVVFYRLLTGALPFQADTPIGMVQKQLWDPPTPVRSYREDLPDWCEVVLTRVLAKAPSDRFQSADEFRSALLSAMDHSTRGLNLQRPATLSVPVPSRPAPPQPPRPAATPIGGLTAAELAAAPTVTMVRTMTPLPDSLHFGRDTQPPDTRPNHPPRAEPPPPPIATPPATSTGTAPAAAKADSLAAPPVAQAAAASVATVAASQPAVAKVRSGWFKGQQRPYLFGGAAAVGLLAVGIGVYALTVRRTAAPPLANETLSSARAESSAPPTETPAASAPAVESASTSAPAPDTNAVVPAPGSSGPVEINGAAGAAPPKPSPAPRSAPEIVATTPPPVEAPPPPAETAAAEVPPETPPPTSPAALLPRFSFSAQTVVVEDGKNRQRETNVELANGLVTVTGKDNKLVTTVPYDHIVGFTYSNTRQPMWNTPQGPAEIAHLDGGAFGFFRGEQHWVSLRTDGMSLVWRVREQDRARVIAALEERIGKRVERVRNR
jgi:serine/threonine-protein kinase